MEKLCTRASEIGVLLRELGRFPEASLGAGFDPEGGVPGLHCSDHGGDELSVAGLEVNRFP